MEEKKITEAFAYFESLTSRGIRTDLSVMERALTLMGNPHKKLTTAIVGGTNGKGSTVSFIGSVLMNAGYNPGLYYSPHIIDFRERIIVGGKMITRGDAAELIESVRKKVDDPLELTYFEFITLMAYVHFADADVNANPAVMEVGLGGRFDAVNVGKPAVSVITNVSLDHMNYLGDTVEEIAMEKAQIISNGGIVVVGRVGESVKALLKDEAKARGAVALFLGEDFDFDININSGQMKYFGKLGRVLEDIGGDIETEIDNIAIGLPGAHQAQNVAVALTTLAVLKTVGYNIPDDAMRDGVGDVTLPGRLEVIAQTPEIIVDVAHNGEAGRALIEYLMTLPVKKTAFVVGMMSDKDVVGFLKLLDLEGEAIFLTVLEIPRAAGLDQLYDAAKDLETPVMVFETMSGAIAAARECVGQSGRVVVAGSFYTVEAAVNEVRRGGVF